MVTSDDLPQFVVLAPQGTKYHRSSIKVNRDPAQHQRLFSEMQRLRGRVAVREQAIPASKLDSSGRHRMPGDEKSWHLLRLRRDGKLAGCARILTHPPNVGFPGLRIAASSVARCAAWKQHVADAVESELRFARQNDFMTIEPGGWVVDEELRGTCEAVSIAISTFAWAQILGDCIGFLTATVKHSSSKMLRRLGGRNLQAGGKTVPRFFDPAWGCNMELLRFDTGSLNPRFETALRSARDRLLTAPVFSADTGHTRTGYIWSTQVFRHTTCRATGLQEMASVA
jgi:predicted GNAT family N-acyltransferase